AGVRPLQIGARDHLTLQEMRQAQEAEEQRARVAHRENTSLDASAAPLGEQRWANYDGLGVGTIRQLVRMQGTHARAAALALSDTFFSRGMTRLTRVARNAPSMAYLRHRGRQSQTNREATAEKSLCSGQDFSLRSK
ncbi:MAG: hypothetical protein ACPL7J_09635, partial [Desulfomonilaceae bacterium]